MAGTPVLTRDGFKNIEDIQPGDYVYSTSDETGESGYKEVLEVFVKETEVITHVFYEVQEEDKEVRTEEIETTLNHRFWSEGEWKSAGTLKAGDRLTLADGTQVEVTEVTFEDRHETVYNMEVADYHTYYVGEDCVWVHNRYGQQGGTTGKGKKKSDTGTIHNDILDSPRTGSALKVDEIKPICEVDSMTGRVKVVREFPAIAQAHGFSDIVDNYAGYATKTSINNGVLYQLEGSLNGVPGRFEWIIQDSQVTHRMFIQYGTINGVPIKP